jgi:hypothetical protein
MIQTPVLFEYITEVNVYYFIPEGKNSELVILYIILLSRGSNPAPPADK